MTRPASPGPDGLRIRQTRDATVIRVFPYRPSWRGRELLASVGAVLVWAGARSGWSQAGSPGGSAAAVGLSLGLFAVLVALGWRALQALRRSQEVLEVYVGKRLLQLVSSRGGAEVRRQEVELVRLEDAEAGDALLTLHIEGGPAVVLPMEAHSDEARGWMVEHLRGAGLGARRRYGHLPLVGAGSDALESDPSGVGPQGADR